jgi:hypothetical protein
MGCVYNLLGWYINRFTKHKLEYLVHVDKLVFVSSV